MSRTACVTGSNGFVGLNLCEELARQGWRVLALHRPSSDITYLVCESAHGTPYPARE